MFPTSSERPAISSLEDEWAWHDIDTPADMCMRRRRRMDIWDGVDGIEVDMHYRDSLLGPNGDELALHEYDLTARSIERATRCWPWQPSAGSCLFRECPEAAPHVETLIGTDVSCLSSGVQDILTGQRCCTHLNDLLRGLAEVPALSAALLQLEADSSILL